MLDQLLQKLRLRRSTRDESADDLLPPAELQQLVGGAYREVGEEFVRHLIAYCSLQPHDAVLDVGCGAGRIAAPLTLYLGDAGMYRGFDVSEKAIRWCQSNITPRFRNFEFTLADIRNGPYNPKGRFSPSEYKFPYPDGAFDVVLLASVFTHLLPAAAERYAQEISRVLKPGGSCLSTFFLLNDDSEALLNEGAGWDRFQHRGPGFRSVDADSPEEGVAYPENFIRTLFGRAGMPVAPPVHYGSWCGRRQFVSFQDIVISRKL